MFLFFFFVAINIFKTRFFFFFWGKKREYGFFERVSSIEAQKEKLHTFLKTYDISLNFDRGVSLKSFYCQ